MSIVLGPWQRIASTSSHHWYVGRQLLGFRHYGTFVYSSKATPDLWVPGATMKPMSRKPDPQPTFASMLEAQQSIDDRSRDVGVVLIDSQAEWERLCLLA